jgi:hypothetical protein
MDSKRDRAPERAECNSHKETPPIRSQKKTRNSNASQRKRVRWIHFRPAGEDQAHTGDFTKKKEDHRSPAAAGNYSAGAKQEKIKTKTKTKTKAKAISKTDSN